MNVAAYLDRLGVDAATVTDPDLDTLARLQRAHVTSVAFENLSITGHPFTEADGPGVTLSTPAIYEKVVEKRKGGFCFELNGLFHSLLDELGYDVDRVAARMVGDDGSATPPANHHVNVVDLDERYVVDVGMGIPTMRQPTPLSGESRTDEVGVEWRVAPADRPDEQFQTEFREPGDDDWSLRYVFSDVSRAFGYFEATCDYLQSAPESPFTGDPFVTVATDEGHLKLTREKLTESVGDDVDEDAVTAAEWPSLLYDRFGLEYDWPSP